jgi:hypothetical protein
MLGSFVLSTISLAEEDNMENVSQTLERLNGLDQIRGRRVQVEPLKHQVASIEETAGTTSTSIELPAEIEALIDNKMFRPKFRKLIRDGHVRDLLELAEIAHTKGRPSHWFATVTAKANWDKTREFLSQLHKVAEAAQQVMSRLSVPTQHLRAVYKACWKVRGNVDRITAKAAETAKGDTFKYFCWLCFKGNLAAAGRQGS